MAKAKEYAIALSLATGNYSSVVNGQQYWYITSHNAGPIIAHGAISLILGVGLSIYCFIVVFSYYRELRDVGQQQGQRTATDFPATAPQNTVFVTRPEVVVMPGMGMGYDTGVGQVHTGFTLSQPNLPPGVMRVEGVNVHQQQQNQFGQLTLNQW